MGNTSIKVDDKIKEYEGLKNHPIIILTNQERINMGIMEKIKDLEAQIKALQLKLEGKI